MRPDNASWDQVFMGLAREIAKRSKDPKAQVGAAVRGSDNRVLAVGFNGAPKTVRDICVPWVGPDKQRWMIHAEVNALLFAVAACGSVDLRGSRLYCTGRPCPGCALLAAHLGVIEVIHGERPEQDWEEARTLLVSCGVRVHDFDTGEKHGYLGITQVRPVTGSREDQAGERGITPLDG